ncbi:hypothetical protein [Pseudidiomarina terrestris]|uniref:hypothetical protein n=1 Tax=Pseudidiomarina terrestris TaxID=2820060 RepID=UPI0026518E18|nr:hypothetical protein [Pseudidiomarina sp. 1ASP75-5]MDN7135360.1 hypothetical protein [Pseudidiomarina sp. 1ASP75-5]
MRVNRLKSIALVALIISIGAFLLLLQNQLSGIEDTSRQLTKKLSALKSTEERNQYALLSLAEEQSTQREQFVLEMQELDRLLYEQNLAFTRLRDELELYRRYIIQSCLIFEQTEGFQKKLEQECNNFMSQITDCNGRSLKDIREGYADRGEELDPKVHFNLFTCAH